MFQTTVPHHNTGSFRSHRTRLPDKEYGEALDCLVKGCSDLLLLSPTGNLLLGKRLVVCRWEDISGRDPIPVLLAPSET